ncbi:MAG: hypothetical protein AAFQ94_14935 [Bacteroidota bacterium]
MSVVTNVIIAFSASENEAERLNDIHKFQYNNQPFRIVSVNDSKLQKGWYGGTKYLETNILIGAYNHLNLKDLIQHMSTIDWEEPEDVQVIVKEQNDDRFRIINLFPS